MRTTCEQCGHEGMTWIQTLKGNVFRLMESRGADFDIEEIAHALAMQCRFNGHVKQFYSVATHSLFVSNLLREWGENNAVQFAGLMHDASEAYVGDLVAPLKANMMAYKVVEHGIQWEIERRFNIKTTCKIMDTIKRADLTMLMVERRDLMVAPPQSWGDELESLELPEWGIGAELTWRQARDAFLCRFRGLS